MPVTISELAFTLALSGDLRMSSKKAIEASAGLGAVDFLWCSEFVTKAAKATATPGTQFSASCSGSHSHADCCLPALGISLSQNDDGTVRTTHRK